MSAAPILSQESHLPASGDTLIMTGVNYDRAGRRSRAARGAHGPSFSNHLRNCVIGNVRHHNSVVTDGDSMLTADSALSVSSVDFGRTWSAQHNVELSLE
jgi:hypothetical protein